MATTSDSIDQFIEEQIAQLNIPGLAVGIVMGSSISWTGTYGFADLSTKKQVDEHTLFMAASVSKTVTTTVLMSLYEKGAFKLDDDISDYLPFEIRNLNHPDTPITFAMLLTHTAGLKGNDKTYPSTVIGDCPVSLLELIRGNFEPGGAYYDRQLNFSELEPGAHWDYSNEGYALIAFLIESITGVPFDAYCRQTLFAPLDMNETSWFLRDLDIASVAIPYVNFVDSPTPFVTGEEFGNLRGQDHYGYAAYPSGQLRTNVLELCRFMTAFTRREPTLAGAVLSRATIDLMTTMRVSIPDNPMMDGIGLCWYSSNLSGRRVWEHRGMDPGVSAYVAFEPCQDTGVAILGNGSALDPTPIADRLFQFSECI
jgi:CubicO group peptidase (beta-lactamase class C family)